MKKFGSLLMALALAGTVLAGCGQSAQSGQNGQGASQAPATSESGQQEASLSGTVKVDGSSTVFPISEAVAEEFQIANQGVQVTVGQSGTGGGFKKWIAGEIDINDASRPIKAEEIEAAKENGIEPLEIPIAYDGISVVVNKDNTWVESMTVEELKKIWEPNSTVSTWKDVRPEWPDEKIKLYGPGTDSGTFEYFTEAVVGEAKASRADYTASEDDNVLVQGVAGDKNALGYFGYAYYEENADKIKVVAIDNGNGTAVVPSLETIKDGSYNPLSRPVFIYPSKQAMEKPEVKAFVTFYLENAAELVKSTGYVPLPDEEYQKSLSEIQ